MEDFVEIKNRVDERIDRKLNKVIEKSQLGRLGVYGTGYLVPSLVPEVDGKSPSSKSGS